MSIERRWGEDPPGSAESAIGAGDVAFVLTNAS